MNEKVIRDNSVLRDESIFYTCCTSSFHSLLVPHCFSPFHIARAQLLLFLWFRICIERAITCPIWRRRRDIHMKVSHPCWLISPSPFLRCGSFSFHNRTQFFFCLRVFIIILIFYSINNLFLTYVRNHTFSSTSVYSLSC